MGKRITVGEKLPFFQYDTPYSAANSFRALLQDQSPLVLVFFSNFGHPVTRTFVSRYAHSRYRLTHGGFAMVVRSDPARLASSVGPRTLPYPLLCDADGVLYDLLDIPVRSGFWRTCSLEAWQILKKARRRGYNAPAGAPQQMPLTLILDAEGRVLFCHYGTSLTDVPADCGAMQELLDELDPDSQSYFEMALRFYEKLGCKSEEFLEEHGFTQDEVVDGMKYIVDCYGYGDLWDPVSR